MKLNIFSFILLLQLSVLFFSNSTFAQQNDPCKGLNFELQTALINMHLEPQPVKLPINVSRSATSGRCEFILTMSDGILVTNRNLKAGQTATYPIQFYMDPGLTSIFYGVPQGSATQIISGSIGGSDTVAAPIYYYAYMDSSYPAPNGTYTGGFSVTLYEGKYNTRTKPQSKNVNYKYSKGGYVDISLVDTGAPFDLFDTTQTLDFGNLVTNATKGFDIVLDYNAGYTLSMSSANAGKIKNTNPAVTANNEISYSMTLNEVPVSLSSAMEVKAQSAAGAVSITGGTRLPVTVTIGNVTGAAPGTYSDTVSISVTTNQ